MNLSDVEIPQHITIFLSLVLKFYFSYIKRKEKTDAVRKVITKVETRTHFFPKEQIDTVRSQLTNILHSVYKKKSEKNQQKL